MSAAIWLAVGAALLTLEVMAPGFFLIVPGIGAALTGIAVAAGLTRDLAAQTILWSLASGLLFALAFQPYRRWVRRTRPLKVNLPDRVVGTRGQIEQPILAGRGKVRIADSVWLAAGPDMPVGTPVEVVGIEGTVVTVAALPEATR